jgi:hypothetical protein
VSQSEDYANLERSASCFSKKDQGCSLGQTLADAQKRIQNQVSNQTSGQQLARE